MGIGSWVAFHWFDLFQTAAITAGLCFTASALRLDIKTRRVDHLIEITQQHREIWSELYRTPELFRIRDSAADLGTKPPTQDEELFISFLILHLNVAYQAIREGVFGGPEGLGLDIQRFFSRPIVRRVWDKVKPLQDAQFVSFIERFTTVVESKEQHNNVD